MRTKKLCMEAKSLNVSEMAEIEAGNWGALSCISLGISYAAMASGKGALLGFLGVIASAPGCEMYLKEKGIL